MPELTKGSFTLWKKEPQERKQYRTKWSWWRGRYEGVGWWECVCSYVFINVYKGLTNSLILFDLNSTLNKAPLTSLHKLSCFCFVLFCLFLFRSCFEFNIYYKWPLLVENHSLHVDCVAVSHVAAKATRREHVSAPVSTRQEQDGESFSVLLGLY